REQPAQAGANAERIPGTCLSRRAQRLKHFAFVRQRSVVAQRYVLRYAAPHGMLLRDHAFLITGGASGLGAACARRFAAAGAHVMLVDLNAAAGEQLGTELGSAARFLQADVTSAETMQRAVDVATEAFGGLHGAINCAGIGLARRTLARDGPHPL